MDDDSEELRRLRADQEVLLGSYVEFLLENGVDLYYDEPEPDPYEYIERYLADPPSHLASADESTLIRRAFGAWEAASDTRQKLSTAAKIALIRVIYLAATRHMLSVTSANSSVVLEVRQGVIRDLWNEKLWREPWITLVNREFPGPEPTVTDVEGSLRV
jgi:hypothetical protein